VNLVTTFMLLSIVTTILMPILSGRVIVVPNNNRHDKSDNDVGVIKSLENLFFGDSSRYVVAIVCFSTYFLRLRVHFLFNGTDSKCFSCQGQDWHYILWWDSNTDPSFLSRLG
jgi:hypothetical protein